MPHAYVIDRSHMTTDIWCDIKAQECLTCVIVCVTDTLHNG